MAFFDNEEGVKRFSSYNSLVKREVTHPLFGIDIGGTLTKCVYFEPAVVADNKEEVFFPPSLES